MKKKLALLFNQKVYKKLSYSLSYMENREKFLSTLLSKNSITLALTALMLTATLTACGGDNAAATTPTATATGTAAATDSVSEAVGQTFRVSDFIGEADNKITKATGGRAYRLTAIPLFPDADKHFYPSSEDYCLMCYPATVYRENIESETQIAKFDLISFDADGKAETHYQAFVFDSAEEAEKYHEFRKTRDGVKYRELYAGSNLTETIMVGCAKRYDNIIYFNMGFQTVGMEDAYNKTYLAGEQSFYEGIGYSFLYSVEDCTSDQYSHYEWVDEDNEYFYPTSHRFTVSKVYNSYDHDELAATPEIQVIEYTLYNYDEYGNVYSASKKFEFPNEAEVESFIADGNIIFSIIDYKVVDHDPIGNEGKFIFDYRNKAVAGNESYVYYTLLGEEYMERDADYDDGQYPEMGMGTYDFFSYRDKECPTEVSASKITANAPIEELEPKDTAKTDDQGTGSWEAYFCSEEIDAVLNKPSCEMFIGKDGDEAILHIYEYRDGVTVYESKARGDFDELFTPEQVGVYESDNLTDPADEIGEYTLTTIDRDNIVLSADYGTVILDYLLKRAEHTVQG